MLNRKLFSVRVVKFEKLLHSLTSGAFVLVIDHIDSDQGI